MVIFQTLWNFLGILEDYKWDSMENHEKNEKKYWIDGQNRLIFQQSKIVNFNGKG